MTDTCLIVGASVAGATAAATLREDGFGGRVILIGEELQVPYQRPPLSKGYLRGEEPFEEALVRPPEFYAEAGVETRFGVRATRVDPSDKVVELAGGDRLHYDKLLIATGSRNRHPPIPGRDLHGVFDLRTVADCDRIRAEARSGRQALVVGMGFIGCEVAASLRALGVEVAAVAPSVPLGRVLGEEIGQVIEAVHRDNGVELFIGDSVAAFEGTGRVERVTTTRGRSIECDFVVIGVGVEPVIDPLAGSGVEVDNGVVVDEYCRTNLEGIYAAGDATNHYHPVFEARIRVEHWDNARKQGAAAARSMLGRASPYEEIHWFWSDQYDYNLQYVGYCPEWDDLVVRGSLEQRDFIAFYLRGGRLLASAGINRGRDVRRASALINAKVPVERAQLADEEVDLRSLAQV